MNTNSNKYSVNSTPASTLFVDSVIFATHFLKASLNILIVDDVHPFLLLELEKAGIEFTYAPTISRAAILESLKQYSGLVIRSKTPADKELIDAGSSLKFIGRAGSGMDNVDVDYAESKGIYCFNVASANADAVGEHALGLLLALAGKIVQGDRQVKNGTWDREGNRGIEIGGKTIGIIGFGHTGSAFARKLAGFGVRIIAFDKYKKGFGNEQVIESTLEGLLAEADIISLHVPLTAETNHLVSSSFISAAAKPFWLINTSRGPVVDTAALIEALASGKIRGAGLDVLENENLQKLTAAEKEQFQKLSSFSSVVLTPHVAGWSAESYYRISQHLTTRILNYVSTSQSTTNQRVI